MQVIIDAILEASKQIEKLIRHDSASHRNQLTNNINSTGDEQKALDVLSNDIMIDALTKTNLCSCLLSEENEDPIILDLLSADKYMVAFDPLDGSSNIDCNVCIGTIFSIYQPFSHKDINEHTLRDGSHLIAAGYVLYGPATEAVIATKDATNDTQCKQYTLSNNYFLTNYVDISSKSKKIYSINEGNAVNWYPNIAKLVAKYKENGDYTQRYIGSMVADVHRTLLYGGMFCYPADKKNTKGKLRLVYECYPMAFITEVANGLALDSTTGERILNKVPTNIHERTPIILGSKKELDKFTIA